MERQWHLVFTLGKCKYGVSGPASDWVKVCLQPSSSGCTFRIGFAEAQEEWQLTSETLIFGVFSDGKPSGHTWQQWNGIQGFTELVLGKVRRLRGKSKLCCVTSVDVSFFIYKMRKLG